MNPITDKYLADNPGVDGNDATWELGRSNPDYLKDPAFAADFKLEENYRKSILTPADYAKQFAGAAVRGVADVVADLPESIAIGGRSIQRKIKDSTGIDTSLGETDNPQDSALWKLGQSIRGASEYVAPKNNDALDESFWATKLPQGLGSTVGFMAGGGVGRAIVGRGVAALAGEAIASGMTKAAAEEWAANQIATKVAHGIPIAGLGAAAGGVGAYKEAKAGGADQDAADAMFWTNAVIGTSEVMPIGSWLDRINKASGGSFAKAVFSTATEATEEALQEALQQFGQNYTAKKYYDKDRDLLKDLAGNAEVGGLTGALFSALTHAIAHGRARHESNAQAPADNTAGGQRPGVSQTEAVPQASPPGSAGVDVTQAYKLGDAEKSRLSELAKRAVAGEGDNVDTAAKFYEDHAAATQTGDPFDAQRVGHFQQEVARLKSPINSDVVQKQLDEANAIFAKKAESSSAEETGRTGEVAGDEATIEGTAPDGGGTITPAATQAATQQVTPSAPSPMFGDIGALKGQKVEVKEGETEAGEPVTLTMTAEKADQHLRSRFAVLKRLIDCVGVAA